VPRQNSQKSSWNTAQTEISPPPVQTAAPSAKPQRRPIRCIKSEANSVTIAPATVIMAKGRVASDLSGAS